jgi:exosortase/archaeosortase family protein
MKGAVLFGRSWRQTLRSASSVGAVLLLVHLARAKDLFGDFTRPTVTFALNLLGIGAVDHGRTIAVGRLEVPWTRDCAGLNLLLVLVALTVWVNRAEPARLRYWIKIALTVPAAVLANVLRVLTLIAYREAFFPSVESPQLHYFLGLVWLLPFMAMVAPRGKRPMSHVIVEALQAAAVVALLAPMSGAPGGDAMTMAAVVGLAHCKVRRDALRARNILTLVWMLAGVAITFIGMESLWVSWLLLCPLLASRRWITSPEGVLLTAATHPLFGMIPGGVPVIWLALAVACWRWLKTSEAAPEPPIPAACPWRIEPMAVTACFVLPFIASTLLTRDHRARTPPRGIAFASIAGDAFDIRLPSQSENIGLVWFNPSGNGRHHALQVCMKYRGIDLEPSQECADVYTDGSRWMREFYLVDDLLLPTYPAYLRRTFRPRSSPGVHLIFATKRACMSAEDFNGKCQILAAKLHERCLSQAMAM